MGIEKPSEKEQEYFFKLSQEQIKKWRQKLDAQREEEAKKKMGEPYWMKCPKCGGPLEEKEMENVKIDMCTKCEGIWLDKGELELIIKRSKSIRKIFKKILLKF
jgi:acetyl-CoA carboxylase beta subunit